MATAWMAKDWPRSTWTHCVPFLNSTASSSTASFLPSVIRLNSPKYGATLLVTVLPAATFVTPLGTSMGGGATSEGGSTFGPEGKFSGVPFSVWSGRSSFSGSVDLASAARTDNAKQATAPTTINPDLNKTVFIKFIWCRTNRGITGHSCPVFLLRATGRSPEPADRNVCPTQPDSY